MAAAGARGRPAVVGALLTAALIAVVAAPRAALACAACGNPSLPQLPSGSGQVDAGAWGLAVSLSSAPLRVTHPAGCADLTACDEVPVQRLHEHRVVAVPVELRATGSYAANQTFGVELEAPLRVVDMSASYQTPDGQPYEPLDAGVHHRDETLVGLGDLEVRGRVTAPLGQWWLSTRLGVALPTGRTEQDPFALGDLGREHQHVQFGTGTFDPVASFDLVRGLPRAQLAAYGMGRVSPYENRHGYRAGPRGTLGVAAGPKLRRGVMLTGLAELAVEGPEQWSGEARQDGMLGRNELLLGGGVLWYARATKVSAGLRVPVWRRLVEGDEEPGELLAPVALSVGVAWRW